MTVCKLFDEQYRARSIVFRRHAELLYIIRTGTVSPKSPRILDKKQASARRLSLIEVMFYKLLYAKRQTYLKLQDINIATDRPCTAMVTLDDPKHARHDVQTSFPS